MSSDRFRGALWLRGLWSDKTSNLLQLVPTPALSQLCTRSRTGAVWGRNKLPSANLTLAGNSPSPLRPSPPSPLPGRQTFGGGSGGALLGGAPGRKWGSRPRRAGAWRARGGGCGRARGLHPPGAGRAQRRERDLPGSPRGLGSSPGRTVPFPLSCLLFFYYRVGRSELGSLKS